MQRRTFLAVSAAVSMAALGIADVEATNRRVQRSGSIRVGAGDVEAVRAMTAAFGDAASELGGGHARHLAVRYLVEDVKPLLDGAFTEPVGRDLFAATSELLQLIGWMARDAGAYGLAQRYHVHSYKLAAEAGDNELAATALRGLADQALALGHTPVGLRLAEACEQRGRKLTNPNALAYYRTTYARALAADSDSAIATKLLAEAETAIEQAPSQPGHSWASHYSHGRWAHETGMIRASMGDIAAAEEHLYVALDIHGLNRKRTRALVLADLGQVQLRLGNIDQALATWTDFINCADGVQSIRIDDALGNVSARISPIEDAQAVSLKERIAARAV